MTGRLASALWSGARERGRLLVAALLIGGVVGGTAGPAMADYIAQRGIVATMGSYCVQSRAEVSHGGWGGGYWKTDTTSLQGEPYTGVNCTTPFTRPAGYLAAHVQGWRYSAGWYVCFNNGYSFNSYNTAGMVLKVEEPDRVPPCGNGYYGDMARSYVLDGGTWHGNTLWSGHHYLPA